MKSYQARRISSADANSTVTIGLKDGILGRVVINNTSAHALTIRDGDSVTGTVIATIGASAPEGNIDYGVAFKDSLEIVVPTGYTGDATICYC